MSQDRRKFIKTVSVAGVGALAGCTGRRSSGGGNNEKNKAERKEFSIGIAPLGIYLLILDEIESNGILKKKEEKYGYSYSLEKTWDEAALFAGGKVDMSHSIGAAEIAEMGPRRGITGVTHGVNLTQYPGMVIKSDSEIAPSKTGGLQESWNLIVEKQKPVGIGGWGLSMRPLTEMVIYENWGYRFKENGDFKILTADYYTVPRLLQKGEFEVAQTAPLIDAEGLAYNPETNEMDGYEFLYRLPEAMEDLGFHPKSLSIGNFVTTKKTSENHTDAVKGWVEAWQEGVDSMYSGDPRKVAVDYVDKMGANSAKEARMMVDWAIDIDPKVIPEDATIDNEYIKNDKAALNRLAELGIIEENWTEYVSYNPISL